MAMRRPSAIGIRRKGILSQDRATRRIVFDGAEVAVIKVAAVGTVQFKTGGIMNIT
jgi:hypothetical protein